MHAVYVRLQFTCYSTCFQEDGPRAPLARFGRRAVSGSDLEASDAIPSDRHGTPMTND